MELFAEAVIIGLGIGAAMMILPFIVGAISLAAFGVVSLFLKLVGKGN